MKFEWDPVKNKTNKRKHGISFEEACLVFADSNSLTIFDEENSSNEDRWITLGQIAEMKLLVVVHLYKEQGNDEFIRIISARKATKNEQKQYFLRING